MFTLQPLYNLLYTYYCTKQSHFHPLHYCCRNILGIYWKYIGNVPEIYWYKTAAMFTLQPLYTILYTTGVQNNPARSTVSWHDILVQNNVMKSTFGFSTVVKTVICRKFSNYIYHYQCVVGRSTVHTQRNVEVNIIFGQSGLIIKYR